MSLLLLSLSLLACTGGGGDGIDSGAGVDGSDEGGGDDGGGDGGVVEEQGEIPAILVSGEVTWTLSFDEAAEAEGYADCSYTRTYPGTQVLDLGYLCPDCDVIVRGEAVITDGLECAQLLSPDTTETRTELWGWSVDGAFFRTGRDQFPLGELTTVEGVAEGGEVLDEGSAALAWESEYEIGDGGAMTLSAAGTMTWETDPETLLPPPFPDRSEPYACGWPADDPGTLALDYELAIGGTLPNARFVDQCGEKLALWDLYGRWLVIDSAQPDCGPCRSMAQEADAFAEDMAAEGIDVVPVTLLGAGLGEPFLSPDPEIHADWVESYGDANPVLFDRGYGYALFPDFVEEATGESFGYPTWIVVNPEMEIVAANVGFSSWDAVAEVIRANQ